MRRHRNFASILWVAGACFTALLRAQPLTTSPANPAPPAPHPLAWDAMTKQYQAKASDQTNEFTFWVTNTSANPVSITALHPSCGCTVATLPSQPWVLSAGAFGPIHANINFAGKHGAVVKLIQVENSVSPQTLTIRVDIPEDPAALMRTRNVQMAFADRQAVFKNDCASCHVTPAINQMGEPLYKAACGICHDSDHRASMVPDIRHPMHPTDAVFWKKWIVEGKTNSLMPAFSHSLGGPLTDEQIASLVEYLTKTVPAMGSPPMAPRFQPIPSQPLPAPSSPSLPGRPEPVQAPPFPPLPPRTQ